MCANKIKIKWRIEIGRPSNKKKPWSENSELKICIKTTVWLWHNIQPNNFPTAATGVISERAALHHTFQCGLVDVTRNFCLLELNVCSWILWRCCEHISCEQIWPKGPSVWIENHECVHPSRGLNHRPGLAIRPGSVYSSTKKFLAICCIKNI